ncbi:hypothetical protein D3C85_1921480 [compost metagenome]
MLDCIWLVEAFRTNYSADLLRKPLADLYGPDRLRLALLVICYCSLWQVGMYSIKKRVLNL